MKMLKLLALLILVAVLSGCAGQKAPSDISGSTPDTSSEASDITEDREEILQLLQDYGEFYYDYFYGLSNSYIRKNVNRSKYVTVEETILTGANAGETYEQYYYKLTGDGITTEKELYETARRLCTQRYIDEVLSVSVDHWYQVSDGELYVADFGAGGLLGYSSLSLDTIEKTADDTLSLGFTVHGDDEMGTSDREFTVIIKTTEYGMGIDECDPFARDCLATFKTID